MTSQIKFLQVPAKSGALQTIPIAIPPADMHGCLIAEAAFWSPLPLGFINPCFLENFSRDLISVGPSIHPRRKAATCGTKFSLCAVICRPKKPEYLVVLDGFATGISRAEWPCCRRPSRSRPARRPRHGRSRCRHKPSGARRLPGRREGQPSCGCQERSCR